MGRWPGPGGTVGPLRSPRPSRMPLLPQDDASAVPGAASVDPFDGLDGEMAARVRSHPWHLTPLGPVGTWPVTLRSTVSTLLACRLPMYLAWGPEFIQIYNDAYRPILGDKDGPALGGRAPDTWSEIWPRIGPMWAEALGGRPVGFDDLKLTINRYGYPEDTFFNFSYSAVRDDAGRAAGVLVTFAETTERVRVSRRLAFLDELAQATRGIGEPAEMMRVTAERLGRHLGVNRCAYAHVHEDADTFDLIGDYNDGVDSIVGRYRFADFGPTVLRLMRENRPYVNADVDRDLQTAGTDLAAYRRTRIQSVICVPLHKDGRFVAAMAVHQNVPRRWTPDEIELVRTVVDRCWDALERLRAQAEVREEARTLEQLNRTGEVLAAELDLDALLQRVTDAATELTGASFGAFFYNGIDEQGEAYLLYTLAGADRQAFESLGHPRPTALFGPTFRGEPAIRIDDVRADPRYGQWAPHHGMPAGHLPVCSYLAVPVVSGAGEVIGGLFFGHPQPAVFTARSERVAIGIANHAAIAIDNARLYAKAQQATAERTQLLESERSARMAAEHAGLLKDEFLATLSHELRTPLSAITGWVHVLRRRVDDRQPEQVKGLDVIARSAKSQAQLIDDLLDMSRITSGKLALDLQPIAPAQFIEAALEVVRPAADAAGVHLTAQLDDAGAVRGDAGRLQQVVWNLLANAVKFTPRGGHVALRLSADGDHLTIRVTDDGLGIHPSFVPHVFDRFRQADGSITRKFGGLGLGLSIVRNLVELHGGSVAAASAGEGQGATFTVTLPRLHGPAVDRDGPSHTPVALPTGALTGRRVLVVDDDPDVRDLMRQALQDEGADVAVAANAADALHLLSAGPFAVLVSDIGMPGVDGYELLARVRRAGGQMPAIAVTAFARDVDKSRALAAGYTRHFAKPVAMDALMAAVAELADASA